MSSQVITTLPGQEPGKNNDSSSAEEVEPGKQKNFYRHVSGAGDGLPLQTTADFGPQATNHIVTMDQPPTDNAEDLQPAAASSPDVNDNGPEKAKETHLEPDWQKKIRSLQDQILAVLLNVDKSKVDVTIGRASIHGDKPVVLAWNKNQQNMSPPPKEEQNMPARPDIIATEEEKPDNEDGVMLYLAIKMKDEFKDEPQEQMRKLFRNDFNNNPGTIQKKIKRSVFKKVTNEKGETVEVEVTVNKRKVTRNIIDEKSGRVMEVETEVTTDDSDEDVMNNDGTVSKSKSKKKLRRGRTGGQKGEDGEEGEQRRRRKSTVTRRRKLTQEEIQAGVTKDGKALSQEEIEHGVTVTRVSKASIAKKKSMIANGQLPPEDEDYFDEEDEYYSDEDYSDEYDDEYYEDDDFDDADIVDISRRKSRFKFDSRGRKVGMLRGRGGGLARMAQARMRRKFCGHGKPGTEEYEQNRAKLGRSRLGSLGDEFDEDDFFDDYDGYVNLLRHEYCFDEFQGYGDDYDGPKGVLTSYLPDGTSVTVPRNGSFDNRSNKPLSGSEALENDILNHIEENKKPSPLLRSVSKISTIPEEDPEHFEDMMSIAGSRRAEDCCTPTNSRNLRPLARAVQVPNRIRRLRSKHVQAPKNLWFIGSVDKSFNSRCSKRFETKDLQQDAVHYYYYRSLPKITQESYLPSITTSIDNIPDHSKPQAKLSRRIDDLLL